MSHPKFKCPNRSNSVSYEEPYKKREASTNPPSPSGKSRKKSRKQLDSGNEEPLSCSVNQAFISVLRLGICVQLSDLIIYMLIDDYAKDGGPGVVLVFTTSLSAL